jgi:PAS domain S-box-containing protein
MIKNDETSKCYAVNIEFSDICKTSSGYEILSICEFYQNTDIINELDRQSLPQSLLLMINEILSSNQVHKYSCLAKKNKKIKEKIYLHESDNYVELKFTRTNNNQAKIQIITNPHLTNHLMTLQSNFEKYSPLIKNSFEGLCVLDKDFNPIFSSPKLKEILGYAPDKTLNLHTLEVIHPDDLAKVTQAFTKLKEKNNGHSRINCRLKTSAGYYLDVEITGQNCLNSEDIQGIVAHFKVLKQTENITNKANSQITDTFNIKSLKLQDLVNLEELTRLMEIFYSFNKTPIGIVDLQGNIISSIGMTDICGKFHRANSSSQAKCIESDRILTTGLQKGESRTYRCLNNMNDLVTPIIVADQHIANLFIGQFFFEDEEIIKDIFRQQAHDYGYNEEEYLTALEKVPKLNRKEIMSIAKFYSDFLQIITDLAHSKIKLQSLYRELEEREEYLQRITDNMTDVVFTADFNFNTTYVSPSIEKLTGFTPEEYLKLPVGDRYTPLAVTEIKKAIAEELKIDIDSPNKNRSNINTLALFDKERKIVLTSIHSKFLRDKNGKPSGIIANIRDITKQYKAEKALERQVLLQTLISSIAVDFINIPTQDIDVAVNDTLAKLANFFHADRAYIFSYDWEKQISINTYEWVGQDISPQIENLQAVPLELMEYWPEQHKQGKSIFIEDLALLTDYPNVQKMLGAQGIKSLISIPLMNNGSCIGFIGLDSVKSKYKYSEAEKTVLSIFAEILVNIKNRAYLEKALRSEREKAQNSDKLKSNLLKNISHEFRTPLNGIVGFSEILQQKSSDFENGNMAGMIHSSAIRLNNVLDSIMLLTQLETINSKKFQNFKTCNISLILQELANIFQVLFTDKNLTFYKEIQPNLYATADANLLNQALTHLLNNALKFTQKGGVQLLCSSKDNNIEIQIIDTGIGIPNESLKLIFSEFRQASEGYNRAYEGVGLGLTIAKKIIDLMNGQINVESQILAGSTFTIKLPLKEADLSDFTDIPKIKEIESVSSNQDKAKILIVEDNTINQKLVISILKEYYNTDLANCGEVAVLLAEKKKYDVILMDIHLGEGIDGLTATRIIKQNSKNITTPIIAVTGYTMIGDKDRILAEGCNYYLGKPYKKSALLEIVQNALL